MLADETKQRLLGRFRDETTHQIALLWANLPRLEQAPDNSETLYSMYVSCHNIKGNLGMMLLLDNNMPDLTEVARRLELIMQNLSKGTTRLEPEIYRLLNQNLQQIELGLG